MLDQKPDRQAGCRLAACLAGAGAAAATAELTDHEECPGQSTSVPQPQFAPGPPGAQITTLTCAADQKLSLLPSAVKGRYFLITTPE